jgi:hypothetical protein
VQREILESEPTAELHVYAVWVPFSGGTGEAADVSRRVLPDPRVTHIWDGDAWDVYYLFGPDATWTGVPAPIVSSGRTIIGQSATLQDAITPLLAT